MSKTTSARVRRSLALAVSAALIVTGGTSFDGDAPYRDSRSFIPIPVLIY